MKKLPIFFAVVILLTVACSTNKTNAPRKMKKAATIEEPTSEVVVKWSFTSNAQNNLEQILERAKNEKKLVFVDAYATWCGPCKLMDQNVFTHSPTAKFFNDNFISYKANIEKDNGPTLKLLYEVNALPGLLFLDAKGNLLVKEENSVSISQLKSLAERALEKAKK